jgi:hypothetical protein
LEKYNDSPFSFATFFGNFIDTDGEIHEMQAARLPVEPQKNRSDARAGKA